jgi:hypothetical protein
MDVTEMIGKPTVRDSVEFRVLDDLSSVAVDSESGQAHALTPVATAIFERCDGTMTVGEMTAELVEIFDCPEHQLRSDVEAFVRDLSERGLIVW